MTSKINRRSALRRTSGAIAVGCSLLAAATPVGAKDLALLTRVLFAIDLAEMLTNVCRLGDPTFLEGPVGPLGGVHDYQLHIKGEVLAGLDATEADQVLHTAADRARDQARKDFNSFAIGNGQLDSVPTNSWCAKEAGPSIRKVIGTHDNFHADIDRLLVGAKRSGNPKF